MLAHIHEVIENQNKEIQVLKSERYIDPESPQMSFFNEDLLTFAQANAAGAIESEFGHRTSTPSNFTEDKSDRTFLGFFNR